jgi:hypothetical protein
VASPSWKDWFSNARVRHIMSSRSDHLPILLEFSCDREYVTHRRFLRYEIMWEREDSLPNEIEHAWDVGVHAQDLEHVIGKLKGVMLALNTWSREKFGTVSSEIERIRKRLEELHATNNDEGEEDVRKLHCRLDELLYREKMMWLQRSRITWLKEGDRNTKFFHQKAVGRVKKNKIKCLKRQDGQVTKDVNEM